MICLDVCYHLIIYVVDSDGSMKKAEISYCDSIELDYYKDFFDYAYTCLPDWCDWYSGQPIRLICIIKRYFSYPFLSPTF